MRQTLSSLAHILLCIFSGFSTTTALAQKRDLTWRGDLTVTLAQITPDDTLGTQVDSQSNVDEITGGQTRGDNLFHSFQDFSVENGSEAFFNNADNISNIFSRVTGGNISTIEGLIRANGNANLFLINPSGIIFGEGAQLNIGGSFFASTANSILFDDGEFSTTDLESPPLLTINMPVGLSLPDNPAEIVNRSIAQDNEGMTVGLEVLAGNNISLVGGDLKFEGGQATASGGNVELGGLSTAGTIAISENGSLNFLEDVAQADITLRDEAIVDVTGMGAGNIAVNARNLDLTNRSFLDAGINQSSTSENAQAGDIIINLTDNLTLDDSRIRNNLVNEGGVGNSGKINITTGSIQAINGGRISSSVFRGTGNAGGIEIDATEDVTFSGSNGVDPSGAISVVVEGAEGNGGDINISAANLTLQDGGEVNASTSGQGDGGDINITTSDSISINTGSIDGNSRIPSNNRNGVLTRVGQNATGNAGNVSIKTDNLTLTNGATVSSNTAGQGNGGDININARDITFEGVNLRSEPSSIGNRAEQSAVGNSGNVSIETDNLTLNNGGQINAGTLGQGDGGNINITATQNIDITSGDFDSGIFSTVNQEAIGSAGNVIIDTDNLAVTNGGLIDASTEGQGDAGLIDITASDTISIDGERLNGLSSSLISSRVEAGAEGNAQGVMLKTDKLTLTGGGYLDTSTFGQGNAGSIDITAKEVTFAGETSNGFPSSAFSQVNPGGEANLNEVVEDAGGDITITTGKLSVTNGGLISTSTFDRGNAGLVTIKASDTISIDGERLDGSRSRIVSRVEAGAAGNARGVTISTAHLNLTNGGLIDASTEGQGDAGLVDITARDTISIDGERSDGTSSRIVSGVELGAAGNAQGVTISTDHLNLTNGGLIDASTEGQGDAGLVDITASDTISIDGENSNGFSSLIGSRVEAGAIGNTQGVMVETDKLTLTGGGYLDASTFGQGNAGSINITAKEVTFAGETSNGFPSSAFSQVNPTGVGNAGGVTISADNLTLKDGGLVSTNTLGEGNSGDVQISIDQLTMENGGRIESSFFDSPNRINIEAEGTGQPGNINIEANTIDLNESEINAETQSQSTNEVSAVINLEVAEDLTLDNNSLISAQALENANGGNLTIDARFIIAEPNSNSDIIASAQQGQGGNIDIDVNSLFGIEERPLNTSTNDINASSEFGLSGTVEINILQVDPSRDSLTVPVETIQAEVTRTCQVNDSSNNQSEFVVTGRGGLPPEPEDNFRLGAIALAETSPKSELQQQAKTLPSIVEATRWVRNAEGKILLLASPINPSSLNYHSNSAGCNS